MTTSAAPRPTPVLPAYLPPIELACAGLAGALWYLAPQLGAWPLLTALAPWPLRWVLTGRPTVRTGFELPVLLFLATAAVAVWSAYDRPTAWEKFWWIVGALVIANALAAVVQSGPAGPQWAAGTLAMVGVAATGYFLATHPWDAYPAKFPLLSALGRAVQAPLPSVPGHRLHPNVVGGLLAGLLPFAIGAAMQLRRPALQAIGAAAGLFMLGGLLLTQSRGAWLSAALAAGLAGVWWLLGRVWPRRRVPAMAALLVMPVAAGLLLLWIAPAVVWAVVGLAVGDANRLLLYREGVILALDYPLIGAGLGGFQMLHAAYARLIHVGFSVHTHNLYLDVAIEQGLPALAALLAAWGVLIGRLGGVSNRPLLGAAVVSLVVIAVHGLVDDIFYGSRVVLLLFAPLAFGGAPTPVQRPIARRAALWGAPVGAAALALGVLWQPVRALWWANLAAVRQNQLELSVYRWPEWPVQDAVRRALDLEPVIAGYERALALNPTAAGANRRLGQIELSLGRYAAARRHLEAAQAARPWDNTTRQLLGEAYLLTGDTAAGQALLRTVNNGQGQLAVRAYWYDLVGETAAVAQLRALTARR